MKSKGFLKLSECTNAYYCWKGSVESGFDFVLVQNEVTALLAGAGTYFMRVTAMFARHYRQLGRCGCVITEKFGRPSV